MAVENHPTHQKVIHKKVRYGCWNLSREQREYRVPVRLYDAVGNYLGMGTQAIPPVMSKLCRNTGDYSKDANGQYSWKPDPSCEGCDLSNKDHEYISKMRGLVEKEVFSLKLCL